VKDIFIGLMVIFVTLTGAVLLVWILNKINPSGANRPTSNTEITFRTACDSVKGQTVWSGREWTCIK